MYQWRSNCAFLIFFLAMSLIPSAQAFAFNFGIAAGSFAQSYQQEQANAAAQAENCALQQQVIAQRDIAREQSGIPQLTRMQNLERHSDAIFQNLMVILQKEK